MLRADGKHIILNDRFLQLHQAYGDMVNCPIDNQIRTNYS